MRKRFITHFNQTILMGAALVAALATGCTSKEKAQAPEAPAAVAPQTHAINISREFDAPKSKVWKTWTEPKQIKRWWGPAKYTAPTIKSDLRVGGKYLFAMKSPEGQTYWSTGTYKEIVPQERIVATDSFSDEKGNVVPASKYGMPADFPLELDMTVTFAEANGKTTVTIQQAGLPSKEMADMSTTGWNESLDKFAVALKKAKK